MATFISDRNDMVRSYDIDANFIINKLCNFDCSYCFYRDYSEHPGVSLLSVDAIKGFFSQTPWRWHLHISGGEPFLRPGFVDLCSAITAQHIISVNTNLTSKKVTEFASLVRPEGVDVINAALHIDEREKRNKIDSFIRSYQLLVGAGFRARALYVMTPPLFQRYERDRDLFASYSIHLEPKAFSGYWRGRIYPQGYSEQERTLFAAWSSESQQIHDSIGNRSIFDRQIQGHQYERRSLFGSPREALHE